MFRKNVWLTVKSHKVDLVDFILGRDIFIRVKKKLIGYVWEFGEKLIDCMLVLMEFHSR
jgi:phenylalanyl-tRNA synthetase beta subunit